MATIRILQGDSAVIEYRLPIGRTVVGRSDTCDLALPDEQVSRTHCLFERSRGGAISVSDRSRHGTYVNGERRDHADLKHGDRIRIGSFILEINDCDSGGGPATAPGVGDLSHEAVLGGDSNGYGVIELMLRVVSGPAQGTECAIPTSDVTVGSCDSRIMIPDPDLLPRHFRIYVNRGRTIVQPETGSVIVDSQRVRGQMPLFQGEIFRAGASEFLVVPLRKEEHPECDHFGEMIGESRAMRRVFGILRRMAGHSETVLLLGESGTGKELAARGLHETGPRAAGPFVPVNCGAITETLFESELFGHERGAFTGAVNRKEGAFQQADKGTLFLDEIGEIPPNSQAKLLRALESGEVRRVGGEGPTFPDVRIVAATNRNLLQEVARGSFREDLYFRLAVLTLRLPPLRERLDDLPSLCQAICTRLHPDAIVTADAMLVLWGQTWPGNVRELRNVLTRAFVLHGPTIDSAALSFTPPGTVQPEMVAEGGIPDDASERAMIRAALVRARGNRAAAAREVGLARTTFIYKLRRLGLDE
jgi:two-component system, NtrC family, response regulator HydG